MFCRGFTCGSSKSEQLIFKGDTRVAMQKFKGARHLAYSERPITD
jgi:hypothetical protein